MAVTVAYLEDPPGPAGTLPLKFLQGKPPQFRNRVKVTFTGTYVPTSGTTGGIALSGNSMGFPNNIIYAVNLEDTSGATTTHLWTYDVINSRLIGYSAEATELGSVSLTGQFLILDATGN